MELNLLDSKILYELSINSRQTDSQIGKKVGKSQQVINYRIKQLIEREIITEFFTVIHFLAFGLSNYIIMVKLKNLNEKEKEKIIKELYQKKEILSVSECGGKWDLIVNTISKNSVNFQKEFSKLLEEYSDQIVNYDLFISMGGSSFGRKYIYQKKNERKTISFGEEKIVSPSATELKILQALSKNARKNIIQIASETGINYKTIIRKIKKLKTEGVITGFRPFINLSKIGYLPSKIYLDLNKMTKKEETDFIEFLSSKKNAIGILKMVGNLISQ